MGRCWFIHLPGEIIAAFLWAQMEAADSIATHRLAIWERYRSQNRQNKLGACRPIIPNGCVHNARMYYLSKDLDDRTKFIDDLKSQGVHRACSLRALHNSPYGLKVARTHGDLVVTEELADRLSAAATVGRFRRNAGMGYY